MIDIGGVRAGIANRITCSSKLKPLNSTKSTSTNLIRRANAGDEAAWDRIVDLYGPSIYRWARIKGLQASDATDVMQEVFRDVVRSLHTFGKTGEAGSFRGWLYVITRNELMQFFRREKQNFNATGGTTAHIQLSEMWDEQSAPNDSISDKDENRIVHRALELIRPEFEESTWNAFWRMTVDGHTATDIGNDLGMTAKAVRQAKYRVLLKLRTMLDDGLTGADSEPLS